LDTLLREAMWAMEAFSIPISAKTAAALLIEPKHASPKKGDGYLSVRSF